MNIIMSVAKLQVIPSKIKKNKICNAREIFKILFLIKVIKKFRNTEIMHFMVFINIFRMFQPLIMS